MLCLHLLPAVKWKTHLLLAAQDNSETSLQTKIAENGTNPDEAIFSIPTSNNVNYFYILSNRKNQNTVLVFSQKTNGQLVLNDEVASGGYGLSDGLGSQGAIAISKKDNLLFAVKSRFKFYIFFQDKCQHRRP